MSDFWNKATTGPEKTQQHEPHLELDPEALAELQEDPNVDIFDEEDADMAEVLLDANLRLEQGRLYQMIMNHDIFGETDADPKAIRNVQREMRKFARERMETMLGMRHEEAAKQTIVSSPFNDMEVTVLKLLASKMSKGATEETSQPAPAPAAPKKDGISAISGAVRPKAPAPLRKEVKPIQREQRAQPKPAPKPQASALRPSRDPNVDLSKPVDLMNAQELLAYDKMSSEIYNTKKYADLPTNMAPMVSGPALEALYTVQAQNAISGVASQLTNGTGLKIR
jgi:hypothetical protein